MHQNYNQYMKTNHNPKQLDPPAFTACTTTTTSAAQLFDQLSNIKSRFSPNCRLCFYATQLSCLSLQDQKTSKHLKLWPPLTPKESECRLEQGSAAAFLDPKSLPTPPTLVWIWAASIPVPASFWEIKSWRALIINFRRNLWTGL